MNTRNVSCYLCFLFCFVNGLDNVRKRKLLLLSFDGFWWNYVNHFNTPNMDMWKSQGISAPEGITATFITKTYPSHYTMATGLHAESHGVINNLMFDPLFNASFSYDTVETRWWNGAVPVWTDAQLQGLKVGTYFWPGTNVLLEGIRPHIWEPYSRNVAPEVGIETAVKWLAKDDLDFVIAYFDQPDSAGHDTGAMSLVVGQKVELMDKMLGHLTTLLSSAELYNRTDIILVSDHGMANVTIDEDHVIVLSDYLDVDKNILAIPSVGALANILPRPGREEYVLDKLNNVHPGLTAYRKEDVPARFHYSHHRRILPIVLFAKEGYIIVKTRPYDLTSGHHGYDNTLPSMRPIFYARGPSFGADVKIPKTYESVNVYPLVCHLLGIKPRTNNGSLEASRAMLRENGARPRSFERPISKANGSCCPSIYSLLSIFFAYCFFKKNLSN